MRLLILSVLTFYYLIYFGIVTTIVTLARDYLLKNLQTSLIVGISFFLAPFVIVLLAHMRPAFSKWLRVSLFIYFRVSTFAKASFGILTIFSIVFIYNYIAFGVSGEQIYLNVFLTNLILVFFITLVLSGRFQIRDPLGLLIRQIGHPEVYLYKDGVLRHIPDPPTLQLLGYSFKDVNVISAEEFQKYTVRPALESVITGRLVRARNGPEVYIIIGGEKRHVPDPTTLNVIQELNSQLGQGRTIEILSQGEIEQWPTGKPMVSLIQQ